MAGDYSQTTFVSRNYLLTYLSKKDDILPLIIITKGNKNKNVQMKTALTMSS